MATSRDLPATSSSLADDGARLLNIDEVSYMLGGVSRVTLFRWERSGFFPKKIIVASKVRWRLADVRAFIARAAAGEAVCPSYGRARGRHLVAQRTASGR